MRPGAARCAFLPWLLLSGCDQPPDPGLVQRREVGASLPYNAAWQIGTHNSYWAERRGGDPFASGPGERILDQILADRARALELDIHRGATPHTFRVYHAIPGDSLCDELEECLGILRGFQRALPEHQPLLVLLEFKELFQPLFDEDHTPADLDRAITEGLGAALYRPADFLAPCVGRGVATLSGCARAAGWPTLADLKGRVLVGTMGYWHIGGGQDDIDWVGYAADGDIRARAAFPLADIVAWEKLDPETRTLITPAQFQRALSHSLFMQSQELGEPAAVRFVAEQGVVRVDNAFTPADQAQAVALGMQIIQTDTPHIAYQDQGAAAPLSSLPAAMMVDLREPGDRLALRLGDSATSRTFAYARLPAGTSTTWETVMSAGADPRRVGCVRAAAALGEGGTSIALCRQVLPNQRGPQAVGQILHLLTCQGGRCATEDFSAEDGTLGGPGDLVSFQVQITGGRSCVSVKSARLVGRDLSPLWTLLGAARCVDAELTYQGLARAGEPDAPGDRGAVHFFHTLRDGAPVRASGLSGVAVEPADGSPAIADATLLLDTSL